MSISSGLRSPLQDKAAVHGSTVATATRGEGVDGNATSDLMCVPCGVPIVQAPAGKSSQAAHGEHEEQEPFYNVRCKAAAEVGKGTSTTMDVSAALLHASAHIRDQPTVPASREDARVACKASLRSDCGVQLPTNHCAFKGCRYTCDHENELAEHVQHCHGGCWQMLWN